MENTGERLLTEIVNQNAIEHIHRYAFALQYVKNKNVIDIASGEGYGSNILASVANAVIGIDISKEAIEHANNKYKRENLSYIHGSADNIPIESNSIDVVVSFETIEHHYKHQEMMTEIKRILNPNGLLIISSPDKLHYSLIPKYDNKYHVKELFVEEFKNLIVNNFTYSIFLNQKLSY
ncbi:MAG TPA: class I SAM-dependent methyltransferase, partial [Bacteroidales bacterium]|nr:class I SAM-dependent methyltransferase [Bacteroidales bacterium]